MPRRTCRLPASHRVVICALGFAGVLPGTAGAQHVPLEPPAIVFPSLIALVPSQPFVGAALAPVEIVAPVAPPINTVELRRPRALPPLYVSFAALQALDLHSTMKGVGKGGVEANPAMKGLVREPAAFVAAKIAATAATFYISERLWRRHRVGAVVLMLAVNGAYAALVANNYRR
jgi:Domain of unknown function (DUF5658)